MSPYEADALSRTIVEGRVRDADRRRLVRELGRGAERPAPAAAVAQPPRASHLWRLFPHHHRHAYS
jgi:hypothetical protein